MSPSPFLTALIADKLHLKTSCCLCHLFVLMLVFGVIYQLCQDLVMFISESELFHVCHGQTIFIMTVYKLQLTDSWFTQTHSAQSGTIHTSISMFKAIYFLRITARL